MVGKKPKQPVKIRRVEPAPEARGFYEKRLAPFLARYSLLLAVCLVTAASARIVATYSQLSLTVDEPGHFACGLEYLSRHVYEYESQHPPLARAMSALGPYLDGVRLRGHLVRNAEGVDVVLHSPNPQRTVALMRLGILPFFWLASLVVFVWARRDFGRPVAVMATGLFTLIPPVLAHSGLATTDMALAACAGAAFFTLILWAESPTWQHSLLLGAASALAVLSKFTALGFLPAAAVAALLFYLAVKWPGWRKLASLAKERAAMFALAVLTGALVVWACY